MRRAICAAHPRESPYTVQQALALIRREHANMSPEQQRKADETLMPRYAKKMQRYFAVDACGGKVSAYGKYTVIG